MKLLNLFIKVFKWGAFIIAIGEILQFASDKLTPIVEKNKEKLNAD